MGRDDLVQGLLGNRKASRFGRHADRGRGRHEGNRADLSDHLAWGGDAIDHFAVRDHFQIAGKEHPDLGTGLALPGDLRTDRRFAHHAGPHEFPDRTVADRREIAAAPQNPDQFSLVHRRDFYHASEAAFNAHFPVTGDRARRKDGVKSATEMLNDPEKEAVPEATLIRCEFVRERNALFVSGDFSPVYTDFYLHQMQHSIRHRTGQDALIKDGLAALALHLASRPWNEAIAWTLSWQDPLQNVFITGSNRIGNIVGRLFTEDVRERDTNLLISQVTISGHEPRQSLIEAPSLDFFEIGEEYYRQSEQRPGRYFHLGDDRFGLITAQPDCDLDWLASLDAEAVTKLGEKETLSLLETREYRFHCGCGPERIFPIIASLTEEALESVFGDQEVITAGCPRCNAGYVITREALEAFRQDPTQ